MEETTTCDLTRGTYRRIWSGFIFGRRICAVSIGAEAWFWRLMMLADDYGNLPADPEFLHTQAGGRRQITAKASEGYVTELEQAGLLVTYTVGLERYITIVGWDKYQSTMARNGRKAQRCPLPSETQTIARSESGSISGSISGTITISPRGDMVQNGAERCNTVQNELDAIYDAYPRKVGRKDAVASIARAVKLLAPNRTDAAAWLLARTQAYAASTLVRTTDQKFIPHPATWFNQGRYDDDPAEWDRDASQNQNGHSPPPRPKTGAEIMAELDKHDTLARIRREKAERAARGIA